MIGIEKQTLNTVPCLIIADTSMEKAALPTMIYFHGFTSAKEQNLPLAYLLAEKGYRVILPDSEYHGERQQNVSSTKVQVSFWDIVMKNVKELQMIKDELDNKDMILNGRLGVAGTSMGGITTSASLTHYPWVRAAAVLMGSPKITTYAKTLVDSFKQMGNLPVTDEMVTHLYEQLQDLDLSKQPEKLNERPLLLWHGENDPVIPFDHSYTFYEEAKKQYGNKRDIKFIKEANRGHKVSRYAILETVKWFEKHL